MFIREGGFDTKACIAHSAKIAFYICIFGAFNQIVKRPAPFLFYFSISL